MVVLTVYSAILSIPSDVDLHTTSTRLACYAPSDARTALALAPVWDGQGESGQLYRTFGQQHGSTKQRCQMKAFTDVEMQGMPMCQRSTTSGPECLSSIPMAPNQILANDCPLNLGINCPGSSSLTRPARLDGAALVEPLAMAMCPTAAGVQVMPLQLWTGYGHAGSCNHLVSSLVQQKMACSTGVHVRQPMCMQAYTLAASVTLPGPIGNAATATATAGLLYRTCSRIRKICALH